MGRPRQLLFLSSLLCLASFFLSLSVSPLSGGENGPLPDWIDDVYLHFDSLRTNLNDYRWPTDASTTMSSAFAEFREIHFHAGIDISTHGRKGYRVLAARDGYVSRILISPYGYGKMLQVRHADGFSTVYAHLQRFNDAIDEYVRTLQLAHERYSLDVSPGEHLFPVSRGDVIAYTGDTGVGPPHLHFEIRDEHSNPVNPLLCPSFAATAADSRPPMFRHVSFAPIDFTARVNGQARPVIEEARFKGRGEYTLNRIVHLNGIVGLSVRATDQVNATSHLNGVYSYELYLDSVLVFVSRLDRFSARETEQIVLHFDWPMVQAGEGRFQKLFVEPGNRQPLYDRQPEKSGILETSTFPQGYHELLVVARDIAGNTALLRTTVVFDEPPGIHLKEINRTLVLFPERNSDLRRVTLSTRQPGSNLWNLRKLEPPQLASIDEGFVLPVDPDLGTIIRVTAENSFGANSSPVFVVPPRPSASNTSLAIAKEFLRDYLLVTVSSHLPFTKRPTLWILSGDEKGLIDLDAVNERTYVGTYPLSNAAGQLIRLEASGIVNETSVTAYDEFSVIPITPQNGGTIVAGDGEFTMEFPANGVYQPLYCRVEKTEDGYEVSPQDVLLQNGAKVSYRNPHPESQTPAGLFFSNDGDFTLLSSAPDGNGVFAGRVSKLLGRFSVRPDSAPPEISRVQVRYANHVLKLFFRLRDNRSGIDPDRLRVTLDDRVLIPEYDPYNRKVTLEEPVSLPTGRHHLKIEAVDRLGNTSSSSASFTVASR